MPSHNLERTNDDIQFVISRLLREVKDPRVQQGMISVTRVETTGDLRYSKIWLGAGCARHPDTCAKSLATP